MNISELFETIQDSSFIDDINGEFTLRKNSIVWTYKLDKDSEDCESSYEDDDDSYCFNVTSSEELLLDAYNEDLESLRNFSMKIEESDNWKISEPDTNENIISFKISRK
jgi:hypothetical protein